MADAYELICGLRLAVGLDESTTFTVDLAEHLTGLSRTGAWLGLKQLIKLGVLKRTDNVKGKRGKAHTYEPLPRKG